MNVHANPRFLRLSHPDSAAPPPAPRSIPWEDMTSPPDRRSLVLAVVTYGLILFLVLGLTWLQTIGPIATGGTP